MAPTLMLRADACATQAEDDDWDTLVAEFDQVMATDPDHLPATRAAWARGERYACPDTPAPNPSSPLPGFATSSPRGRGETEATGVPPAAATDSLGGQPSSDAGATGVMPNA